MVSSEVTRQFGVDLQRSLHHSGYKQPDIQANRDNESQPWRIVAPGVIVRPRDYEARYGSINLEGFRHRMRPEVFRAFVRHIGLIEGVQGFDINELADRSEDD